MSAILDLVSQAAPLLSDVARSDFGALSDDGLIAMVKATEQVGRSIDTARVLLAGEVAERSRYELGAEGLSMRLSERKAINFFEQLTLVSQGEASRRIRLGLAVRPRRSMLGEMLAPERPIMAEAMTRGAIGIDTAATILYSLKQAAHGHDATPERLDEAELALTTMGATDSADLVADYGRLWRDALDPDGIEPRYEDILDRQTVTVGRQRKGIKNYNIKAAPKLSALLDAALMESMDPNVGPRFLSDEDLARAPRITETRDGVEVLTIIDPRTIERRRADYLEGVLTAGLRATGEGPANFRTVGTVTAIIQFKDLEAGTGFGILEGSDEVVSAAAIQEMVCDTGYYQVLLGAQGQPLYDSVLQRYFTPPQRRAMIARDGDRCIAKGCKKRAAQTHAHHVIFWADGGPTDIDNGVLLCPAHHHALHQGAFEIRMIDGMPHIRASTDRHDDTAWTPASHNRLLLTAS